MATLNNRVFDEGLSVLDLEANQIHVTSQEATSYAEAITTYTLGDSSSLSIGAPQDRTGGGREVVVAAIVDTTNSRLLATSTLTASQAVTNGNTFTLSAVAIGIPDPV